MDIDRFPFAARLCAALLLLWSVAAPRPALAIPAIEHWVTDNGVRIYFVPARELPMVDIRLVLDAGSARDGDHPGLAYLTNSLLGEGASQLDADAIAERFARLGAQFSTDCGRDMATVSLRSLSEPGKLKPALALLAGIVAEPSFPQDAVARVLKNMRVALQAEQQSPDRIAEKAFFRALYGDHPYGSPLLGDEDSLAGLQRSDVRAFYRRYYAARNAALVLVGDLARDEAERIATLISTGLTVGEAAAPLPEVPMPDSARQIHIEYPSSQTHILVGEPGLTYGDPDYFPLYVGNHTLGGSGLVSRISEEIREQRGLAYSAYSYFFAMRRPGPFMAGLQTRSDQAGEALAVLQETIRRFIADGPSAEELQASKQNITGGFPLRLASNRKIAANLTRIAFYGLPLDYLDSFSDRVEAVTRKQIRAAFQRHIDPGRLSVVTVGRSAPQP